MRTVGKRIIQTLSILEREGPSNFRQVAQYVDCADARNVSKYLQRAAYHRLATVQKNGKDYIYKAVPGWQDLLEKENTKPEIKQQIFKKPLINSVWALAINA